EVGWQVTAFKGDPEHFDDFVAQGHGGVEALARFHPVVLVLGQARVGVILGRAVIVGGAEEKLSGADAMPFVVTLPGLVLDLDGELAELACPTPGIAVVDLAGGGETFPECRAAVWGHAQHADHLEIHLWILESPQTRCTALYSGRHGRTS